MKNLDLAKKIIKALSNTGEKPDSAVGNIMNFFREALKEQGLEESLLIPFDAVSEKVKFKNEDGNEYSGLIFKNNNSNKWVIGLHGYSSSKESMAHLIWFMHEMHYNLFLFDFRNHGESFSDQMTFGIKEREDLIAAIKYLGKTFDPETIGLYGGSMGAFVLNYFALTEPEMIKKYHINFGISDSTYWSIRGLMKNLSIANWPVIKGIANDVIDDVFEVYQNDYGVNLNKGELDLLTDNAKNSFPILYLHGKNDKITSWENSQNLYEERHEYQKSDAIKIFNNGPHVRSLICNQESYVERVKTFLKSIGEITWMK
jgi:esterase/lipase